ncbi:MAG: calcium:proton antiporter [Terrimicrobiaceae bacterium]|jgi:Ca2+:H+ antiporter
MKRSSKRLPIHWGLAFGILTSIVLLVFGHDFLENLSSPVTAVLVFVWLVPAILGSAFSVVRHADALAHRLGEPYGTLILTLSVTVMEVSMIAAVMLTGPDNPTLARDTMFAVVMIVLGGLVGVSLLVGGLRHRLQEFNLEGANAFISLIIPLSLLGMIMPNFTVTTSTPTFSTLQAIVIAAVCFCAYGIFLAIQTIRHREFFVQEILPESEGELQTGGLKRHVAMLVVSLVPVVFLAEQLAKVLEFGIDHFQMPQGVAGLIVAALILAPEGMGGIQAASRNHMQRSVNLLLGSVLATISLTIPSVLLIGLFTNREIVLGLPGDDSVMLAVILALSVTTFGRGRTNLLQGAIHLLVFFVWIVLLFEG